MVARVLVVEDDAAIQELISVNLLRAGHQVQRAHDAESALVLLHATLPDLIVMDWGLPGISGIELTRRLRAEVRTRAVSIIMLTARDDERDKVAGLEAGADDYLTKPFSPRELLSRIAAVLRRRVPQAGDGVVEVGGLRIDPAAGRATLGGSELALGRTEFRLLHYLMAHADRVHSRARILDEVWGERCGAEERTVDVHIRRLRSALEPGGCEAMIRTVRGGGYSFSAGAG